jgi:O-glycosyl hydrolase
MVGHSYFTTWPDTVLTMVREGIAQAIQAYGLEYWMSEYCMLEHNPMIKGGGRDLGMDAALYLARLMHHDLVTGQASSWQWWLGLSCYDFKDGLVYTDKAAKEIFDSKMLWAMGQYSAFIRPGAKRIGIENDRAGEGTLMVSAYSNQGSGDVVIVVTNLTDDHQTIEIGRYEADDSGWEIFVTSDSRNLEKAGEVESDTPLMIPARSIVTLYSK